MSRDFGLDKPSPKPKLPPPDGHKILRTLAAVVAAFALVFIGVQQTRQADLMERQNTILACHSAQEGDYDSLMLLWGPNNPSVSLLDDVRSSHRECRTADE
jgi:hypothetical protein